MISLWLKDGNRSDQLNLDQGSVFLKTPNDHCIYESIKNELANARQGTSNTLTRSMVSGSNKKPWAQKGLGRARSGDRKSPIWRGGGVIFGPSPRDYSYKLPKKVKFLGLTSAFSKRVLDETVKVIEDWGVFSGKTKDFSALVQSFSIPNKDSVLVILDRESSSYASLQRSIRNIPNVHFANYKNLLTHQIFYARHILIDKSTFLKLNDFWELR